MQREITSKHLGTSTELTVIMPIKPGLVGIRRTMTYATRLRLVLKVLNGIRKKGVEDSLIRGYTGPVERLRTISSFRWCIIDNDTRFLLAVVFDSGWETYIRKIADEAGPLLDVMLCHCEGYEDYSSDLGYPRFAEWVRRYQQECGFFYSGLPDITIDDLEYLVALEQRQRSEAQLGNFDIDAARLKIGEPDDQVRALANRCPEIALEVISQKINTLAVLHKLTPLFPKQEDGPKDWKFLHRTAHAIITDFDTGRVPKKIYRAYADILSWYDKKIDLDPAPRKPPAVRNESEVQGDILSAYRGMTHACLLLLRLRDPQAAHDFLTGLPITKHGDDAKIQPGDVTLNLAFTYQGLQTLRLPEQILSQFPKEFREGMGARAGLLGDIRSNHPERWVLPKRNGLLDPEPVAPDDGSVRLETVDLVIQLQTQADYSAEDHRWTERHPLFSYVKCLLSAKGNAVQLLSVQAMRRYRDPVSQGVLGHFGFRDGISQPTHLSGAGVPQRDRVKLGEFLLGYENDRGDLPEESPAELQPIVNNGTFLVVRKLEQDVAAFNRFVGKHKGTIAPDVLKAKMMGRYPDGRPLVAHRSLNDFDYADDPGGDQCPLHSHIRRTNPRTPTVPGKVPNPRILRRGFSYGPSPDIESNEERGLLFMAYAGSIAEQFEVVQQWVAGANSTGVLSTQDDALLGVPMRGKSRTLRFVEDSKVRRFEMNEHADGQDVTQFVTLRWGMYLFAPSIRGLNQLADSLVDRKPHPQDALIASGNEIIGKLKALEKFRPDGVELEWKKLLEDLSAKGSGATEAVWAAIRSDYGGVLPTPYGVLVGGKKQVMDIFRDPETFSVRHYWDRMDRSLGEGFLGMDPDPQPIGPAANEPEQQLDSRYRRAVTAGRHGSESQRANALIAEVTELQAFGLARDCTTRWLQAAVAGGLDKENVIVPVRLLVADVFAWLSNRWFGLPRQTNPPDGRFATDSFISAASFIFTPNPTDFVSNEAEQRGRQLLGAAKQYVAEGRSNPATQHGSIAGPLFEAIADDEQLARTLGGIAQGFVAPTSGSFMSTMHTLIESEHLWRLQQSLIVAGQHEVDWPLANKVIRPALVASMQRSPVPDLLHRTAVKDVSLGDVEIKAGDKVVLGLLSATREQPGSVELLFGGDYDDRAQAPVHACSGQKMGMGVIIGMICAILESGTLRPLPAPLTLSLAAQ